MTHEARRRLVRIVTVCIVIALVIAAGEFSLRIHADRRPPGYATGDPLDIRLTGVWNPVTSEIRDASGNRIGETLGVFGGFQTASPPWMHRNFSFEMSQDADGITFGPCTVSPSGTTRGMIGSGPRDLAPAANSRKRVFVPGSFLRTYDVPHWLSRIVPFLPLPRRKIDVKEVDVTIRWWDGPRGEAAYTFTGPFEASKTYTTGGAAPATLTVSDYSQPAGGWGTRFHFVCPRSSGISCFLVYDRDGNRRNDFCMSGGTRGPAGIDHVYAIAGLARQDISAVTSGEMPRERTFHNIKVACDGPEPEYPPYFDLAAERLGVPYRQGQGFENYNYASGEDIIKVADVLRGNAITYAGHRLLSQVEHRGWYASLPEADRAKLMDVLRQWGASDDPQTRAMAVQIGIVADPEAFVGGR